MFDTIVKYAVQRKFNKLAKRKLSKLVTSADIFAEAVYLEHGHKRQEQFVVFFVNASRRIITQKHYSSGTINNVSFYIREVARDALLSDAVGIIMCHSHPNTDLEISELDQKTTKEVQDALKLLDIKVFDHVLVGKSQYMSFKEKGLI